MLSFFYLLATNISPGNLPHAPANSSQIKTVLSIIFAIAGALAFLMIVISGFRYIISAGDPARVSQAKDGIIFALIGLLIAITAEAMVALVTSFL